MGKPAARRLLEAVKKRKTIHWGRNLIHKIIPVPSNSKQNNISSGNGTSKKSSDVSTTNATGASGLTCLIQEKDVR